jgi:HipA-like protein
MPTLIVWHHSLRVGVLHVSDEGCWVFTYDKDWITFPLSLHLPLGETRQDLVNDRVFERLARRRLLVQEQPCLPSFSPRSTRVTSMPR